MTDLVMDQIDLVCADVDQTVAFYRALGLDIPEGTIWRTDSGAHHVEVRMENGFELAFNSQLLAREYNQGNPDPSANRKGNVISFRISTREEVDSLHSTLTGLGYSSSQPPYNAFWGSRYAIVEDPDGNLVGLMSPPDAGMRTGPPDI